MKIFLTVLIMLVLTACQTKNKQFQPYESTNLKIEQIAPNTFIHVSYLETKSWGKVPCNGMVVIRDNEAIVFDTPSNDKASEELIQWIQRETQSRIKAVVATHFHVDCLGGLAVFHRHNIPSYGHLETFKLALADSVIPPQNAFSNDLIMAVGKGEVRCDFVGEGHTKDNIIAYYPGDQVLFGGCLVKSDGAGKGNLNDANIAEWPRTIARIKEKFDRAKLIIPGHGKPGGRDLLDYTQQLFR